jgi:hypothetical protein
MCSGSQVIPAPWPAVSQPNQPTPARSTPACRATTWCAAHSAWSDHRPARRRSAPHMLRRHSKTAVPAGRSLLAAPPPQHRPACVHTGCAPDPIRHRTPDNRPPWPVDTPRSAPTHQPAQPARPPHPPDAEKEPQQHHDHHTANHDHTVAIKKLATTHPTGANSIRESGPDPDPANAVTARSWMAVSGEVEALGVDSREWDIKPVEHGQHVGDERWWSADVVVKLMVRDRVG